MENPSTKHLGEWSKSRVLVFNNLHFNLKKRRFHYPLDEIFTTINTRFNNK